MSALSCRALLYVATVLTACTVHAADTIKINFQPSATAIPSGYLPDYGITFGNRGNGYSYGWNENRTTGAVDRNSALAPDQRFDTFIAFSSTANWEIALPNGHYQVRVVCGDPTSKAVETAVNAEGKLVAVGPGNNGYWYEATRVVTVADGALTLTQGAGATGSQLSFVEITPSELPPPPTTVVCFGDSNTLCLQVIADTNSDGRIDWDTTAGLTWPARVQAKNSTTMFVVNEGKNGRTTTATSELATALARSPDADVFIINLGTNDMKGFQTVDSSAMTVVRNNLQSMLSQVRAALPNAKVMVCAPININVPTLSSFWINSPNFFGTHTQTNLNTLATLINTMTQSNTALYANLNGVVPAATLTGDGVHPNATGCQSIADTVWAALQSQVTFQVNVTADDDSAAEPADGGVLTFTRTGITNDPLTVNYAVAGSAAPGVDYTTLAGSVTFPALTASVSLNVDVIDDELLEASETVAVTLTADPFYVVGTNASATVNLASNDAIVIVSGPTATPASPIVGTEVQFSGIAVQPEATYQWTFGDGGNASGGTVTHTYTSPGDYTVAFYANHTPSGQSQIATITVTVRPLPVKIVSSASASGQVGQPFGHTIQVENGATAINVSGLPEGLIFDKKTSTISGTPLEDGVFSVSVSAENASGTDAQTLTLTIVPETEPPLDTDDDGIADSADSDDDNDGVSDELETLLGTDPLGAGAPPQTFTVLKFSGAVKAGGGKDSVSVSGVIPALDAGYKPLGVAVDFNASGANASFVLDAKGKAKGTGTSFQLKIKGIKDRATGVITHAGGDVTLKAQLKGGTWADEWASAGVNLTADPVPATLNFLVKVKLGDSVYYAQIAPAYSGKPGKGGRFKR